MSAKHKFVQSQIDYINNHNIEHALIGHWIRAIHYCSPIFVLILIIVLPKNYVIGVLILFVMFIVFPFIIFKGCWISTLEDRLLKDNINICDLGLFLSNFEINYDNRIMYTLYAGTIYIFILLFIFFVRFY